MSVVTLEAAESRQRTMLPCVDPKKLTSVRRRLRVGRAAIFLGELANVGTAAAVANAVYHATGTRIRELPIRLEKLARSCPSRTPPGANSLQPGNAP